MNVILLNRVLRVFTNLQLRHAVMWGFGLHSTV